MAKRGQAIKGYEHVTASAYAKWFSKPTVKHFDIYRVRYGKTVRVPVTQTYTVDGEEYTETVMQTKRVGDKREYVTSFFHTNDCVGMNGRAALELLDRTYYMVGDDENNPCAYEVTLDADFEPFVVEINYQPTIDCGVCDYFAELNDDTDTIH